MKLIEYNGQELSREDWEKVIEHFMTEAQAIRKKLDSAQDE